ncbi:MAG: hypothetical protein JJE29_02120 [Peptostreptococcaceae bacterium]|nr:hypothetical protein [Peptostreptococcaceae bacterium]
MRNINFALGFQLINVVILLVLIVASIYSFVLFIKLARRGIKALDIYIGRSKE